MVSMITAQPDLSSPPSTVVPSVRMMSPSMIGLTPSPGTTVSMCALIMIGSAPGIVPLKARDDVAGVSADFFAGVVNLDFRAHLFAVFFNALGNVALFTRVAVNLYKFEKKIFDALLINHFSPPQKKSRVDIDDVAAGEKIIAPANVKLTVFHPSYYSPPPARNDGITSEGRDAEAPPSL